MAKYSKATLHYAAYGLIRTAKFTLGSIHNAVNAWPFVEVRGEEDMIPRYESVHHM